MSAFDEALTSGKVYVLLFGLSIHSLFEGLGNCFQFLTMFVHVRFHVRVYVRVIVFCVIEFCELGFIGLTHVCVCLYFPGRPGPSKLDVFRTTPEMKQFKVIGFEKDHGGMWTVLITILVHKSLLAFSLGLSAFKVFHHFKNCLYAMIIFCISRIRSQTSGSLLVLSRQRTNSDIFGPVRGIREGSLGTEKVQLASLLEHF